MRAEFSLNYDVLTVEQPQKLYLMARFEAGEAPGDRVRRPLNISLVIDRSGSMAGDKIDYTRQAAQFLVQHLGAHDILSIVLYNDEIETLVDPEYIANKDRVTQLLEGIRVRGTTNLSGGWLEGCQHVDSQLKDSTLNRVILMSDGLANRGVTDMPTLVSMARRKHESGISTTAMGLGKDFNEDLMMEMASAGGGAFYFIESPEVAPLIFQEELSGLLNVVGQNLSITVIPGEYVRHVRQLNAYSVTQKGAQTTFRLGDIFGSEVKTLLLELDIPALESLGEQQIAMLRFEYDEIAGDDTTHQVKEMPVMVNVKSDAEPKPLPNTEVEQSVLLLRAAHARQEAVQAADRGNFEKASTVLRNVADAINDSQVLNDHLKEERDALLKQAEQLGKGPTGYDQYSRKTMSTQAFYTMTNRHDDTVMLRQREQKREKQDNGQQDTIDQAIPPVDAFVSEVEKKPGISPTHVSWKENIFELTGDVIRLGRSSHNEIIINEHGVSRFHSQLRREGDQWLIEDLGSTNGTRINGVLLSKSAALSVGDVVLLCDAKLVFRSSAE